MHVRDSMTPKPITITVQESLQGAMELMAMKRIRHLPVVDATGKLIGMVTDRDLRRAAPSPLFGGDHEKAEGQLDSTSVERIMIRSPATIGPVQRLQDAMKLMVEKKYGALPVVDGIRLVGIITPIDVMKSWLKAQP
jgi:acetoin utilization protein AcuB